MDSLIDAPSVQPDEIEAVQYLRPYGQQRKVYIQVGLDYVRKAQDMIIEAEIIPDQQVAFFVRYKDEPMDMEILGIAYNCECFDKRNPTETVKRCIDRKWAERYGDDNTDHTDGLTNG